MKNPWKVIVMLTLLLAMGIAGCGGGMSREHKPDEKSPQNDADIPFRQESPQHLPAEAKEKWDAMQASEEPTGVAVHADGRTYVIAALGMRRTGGYRIEVQSIYRRGQTVDVYAEEHAPAPGSLVIQVITYPVTVVSIPQQKDAVFRFHIRTVRPPAQM